MKEKLKYFIIGVLVASILSTATTGFAITVLQEISVDFNSVNKIIIDGVDKTPTGDLKPFAYKDRNFVPLRYIAEAFGKKVDWDGATRTITITSVTPSETQKSETPSGTQIIEDDFSGPLSNNWDVGRKFGEWTVNQNMRLHGGSGELNFLPLSTDKYTFSNQLTIECDIIPSEGSGNYRGIGVFLKGGDKITGNDDYPYPYRISVTDDSLLILTKYVITADHKLDFENSLDADSLHRLKVVLNGNTVDIYIDDKYIMSDEIPKNNQYGHEIGLYTYGKNDYMKNFKVTVQVSDEDILPPDISVSPAGGYISPGDTITITADDPSGIHHIGYAWDNDKTTPVYSDTAVIKVPNNPGRHILHYYAKDNSNNYNWTKWKSVEFNIKN